MNAWIKRKTAWVLAAAMAMTMTSAVPASGGEGRREAALRFEQEQVSDQAATPADAAQSMLLSAVTGNLWDEFTGEMNWSGAGTKNNPYGITNLSQLMGLSEAVAQGETFAGQYFELKADLDLGLLTANGGNWNPIGWFKNATDLAGSPAAFMGTFDGAGHTVSGLKFTGRNYDYSYLGLFGKLDNATVKNLTIEAGEVAGADNVGILAGQMTGRTVVKAVTVRGSVYAKGDAGGIAGEVTGGQAAADYGVIENCIADGIVINSAGTNSFVGGIAGNVQRAVIADCTVITYDGDASRIQGKGYVGGIAGRMNKTDIYNARVEGTIGGNGARAVGGILGLYESGNGCVLQMYGEIGRTNNGAAAREGSIIGTRQAANPYRLGTGKNDNFSYLFLSNAMAAKKICGSGFADDNTFTKAAHIGYATDYERKYVLVAGTTETGSGERYLYEELEDGIHYIITQKLGKQLTADHSKGLAFAIDHFAPGSMGEPVLGYLISIPRIDTKNANGTYDHDVAVLTAMPQTNNSYYRAITKERPAAAPPGAVIQVVTAANNREENRYQMIFDSGESGQVKPPTYTDEDGQKRKMTYGSGGAYSFIMPAANTELNAEYAKVTTDLAMSPSRQTISIVHTRTGDRKSPHQVTEVKDHQGRLIARYINGKADTSVQIQPVLIHAEHNGQGSAADRTVTWSVDDTDLIHNLSDAGYTLTDARIMPNLDAAFIQTILNREVQAQIAGNYREAINNTIYEDKAVVTASTNPATSVNNQPVHGNSLVNVTFQILDLTTVRVEGLKLNHSAHTFEIIRKLTGDRKNPTEQYLVSEPLLLDASLNPEQPFFKNVSWKDTNSEKTLRLSESGTNNQQCKVVVAADRQGKDNPAWIQNVINEDNTRKNQDKYRKLTGSASHTETITATSEDQTHGVVTAACAVTVVFRTVDETVIHPEGIELDKQNLAYQLSYTKAGDIHSETVEKTGFGAKDVLAATVLPGLADNDLHQPYNREVVFRSSDPDALAVDEKGRLTVNDDAKWIREAQEQAPYQAQREVEVTVETADGQKRAVCRINLDFWVNCLEIQEEKEEIAIIRTKTAGRLEPSWSGLESRQLNAAVYPQSGDQTIIWTSSDPDIAVDADGRIIPAVVDAEGKITSAWVRNALNQYPYQAEKEVTITAASRNGALADQVKVKVTFASVNKSGSSSGGGSGSSSSGSSGSGSSDGSGAGLGAGPSSGPAASGNATSPAGLPDYVIMDGEWLAREENKWQFSKDGLLTNRWAALYNPYADTAKGQRAYDWFRFDEAGYMVTGWYTDTDGKDYYLHPVSDGTQGHMYTGWKWIDPFCYYFEPRSNGQMGSLYKNTKTPDGFMVNQEGIWNIDGVIQTQK